MNLFKTENIIDKLPNKLHLLLELALNDLKICSENSNYQVDMELYWHVSSEYKNKCSICLAGAVMANTLSIPIELDIVCLSQFNDSLLKKFKALDYLRAGKLRDALDIFYDNNYSYSTYFPTYFLVPVTYNQGDENLFWLESMNKIVEFLKENDI